MAILSEYLRPSTVAEAERLLQERGEGAIILAGGTQVVADWERRTRPAIEAVIDIGRLGLGDVRTGGELLRAGATATLTDLIENETAAALAGGLLVRAARGEGPPNLRNAMTLGGVVAGAQTDSEVYAALLALGASVLVTRHDAPVPLAGFTAGARIITEVLIPLDDLRGGLARVARTPTDRPIVAAVAVAGAGGTRVALCGVGERPILDGDPYRPFSDFKGSADYRQAMAAVLKARALAETTR
jgi:CO/xanthine dehydrogenase FAD-binding subunit